MNRKSCGVGMTIAMLSVATRVVSAQSGPSEQMVRAFDASILFMLLMPFTLAAIVGGALYYTHRKRLSREEDLEP